MCWWHGWNRWQRVQQNHRAIAIALGLTLLAPCLLAPDLAGVAPLVLGAMVATIGSPLAVIVLWAAQGRHLAALGWALGLTCAGVLCAGALIVSIAVLPSAPSTRGSAVSYVVDQTLLMSVLPMAVAVATALVLLPFAWVKSRNAERGRSDG